MSYPDIRRAQPSDQDAVGDLWRHLLDEQAALDDRFGVAEDARDRWDNDFPLWLEDETYRVYVAEPNDEIVGFATAHRWGPPPIYAKRSEVYLDELYIDPDARRDGLGRQLVAAVQDWSDRIGARRLRLSVLSGNEEARAFWTSLEAQPLRMTFTIEGNNREAEDDEGSKKIGF